MKELALEIRDLPHSEAARCDIFRCVDDVICEVTWNSGLGRKLLCTKHKKQIAQDPELLRTWSHLGP
jgi:hypothetical protein